jgi:uncharacterized protein
MADSDASLTISIVNNNMRATVEYIPAEGSGKALTVEDVVARLSEAGVVAGIHMDNIRTMCASSRPLKTVVVAESIKPQVGQKARIEPYISLKKGEARARDDGSVDFHDLGEIVSAAVGQKLYRRIPPTIGNPGYDVTGKEIPGLLGKDLRIMLGNGTALDSADPDLVIATQEGELIMKNGVLAITELHNVKGDVDFSTGNIIFKGSIKIGGTVRSGFTVEAGGNIQINGNIEDSKVIGAGDITVLGGFAGTGQGLVKADGDVTLKFVENQSVKAGRDIILNGVSYHSHLEAGRSIIAKVGKGTIIGGQAEAKHSVEALRLGSMACVSTVIRVGLDPEFADRMQAIEEERIATKESDDRLDQSIMYLNKLKIDQGRLTPEKAALLEKMEGARRGISEKLDQLNEQRGRLVIDQENIGNAFVSVDIAGYPKVRIYIGNQVLTVEDNLGSSVFKIFEGDVVRFSKDR